MRSLQLQPVQHVTFHLLYPPLFSQLNSGGRFDAIAWQRLAALLGKEPRCLLGTYRWVWTSWATTSNLTLVAELIEPYLVLHLLALCWPCFFALLIWPWAGHAAYRS